MLEAHEKSSRRAGPSRLLDLPGLRYLAESGGSDPFLIAYRSIGKHYNRDNLTSETYAATHTILTDLSSTKTG